MVGMLKKSERSPLARPWFRSPLPGLRRELEDVFASMWPEGEGWFAQVEVPTADMSETDNAVEVRMDLPGVKPEEIHIELDGDVLTISGEKKEEKEEKGKTFHRIERFQGKFARSMRMPAEVAMDKVEAKIHEGVLTVTLPKTEVSKAHKIEVQG